MDRQNITPPLQRSKPNPPNNISPPPPTKTSKSKLIIVIGIILILAMACLLGIVVFIFYPRRLYKPEKAPTKPQNIVTSPSPPPLNTEPHDQSQAQENNKWQTFVEKEYGLSFKYPATYTVQERVVHNEYYVQIIVNKDRENEFVIRAQKNYSPAQAQYFLDTQAINQEEISQTVWQVYFLPQGYGDGEDSTNPIYGLQTEKNGVLYSIAFFNQSAINPIQKQILSTLQFQKPQVIDEPPLF